jgi:stage IV sporulation protein FB
VRIRPGEEIALMFGSLKLGKLFGIDLYLHGTFWLLPLFVLFNSLGGGTGYDAFQLLFVFAVFGCVALHEVGHALAAAAYGVRTRDITLYPIGGVASLERMPEKPWQEVAVALAGPAVNVVIAVVLYLALGGWPTLQSTDIENPTGGLLPRLAMVNVFLVVFNLIPAFPMDGGRVLRALLAYRMGFARATQVAATVGQGIAFLLGLLGLMGNPLLLFVALFVYLGAAAEAHSVQIRQVARGMVVGDAMVTHFETLSPLSSVEDAVQCLIRTTQHEFPVVDGAGRLRGVLTRDAMIQALRQGGPSVPVIDVMQREIPVVHRRQNLDDALRAMQEKRAPAVGVTEDDGRLVGLVTPENIGEIIMVQAAQPNRGTKRQPQPSRNPWV